MAPIISRGLHGRRGDAPDDRVPPGQHVTKDFPVLSAGPTPHTPLERWAFSIVGEVDEPRRWTSESSARCRPRESPSISTA
jgi:DMSO/TMAO reductase YedYZ molybdopterin-dependent catalytic subunit